MAQLSDEMADAMRNFVIELFVIVLGGRIAGGG
jgi:hypothetical protein